MRRPTHPTPYLLKKFLRYNQASGYCEITQDDITYHVTLEQTVTLKNYFRHNEKATPGEWFNSLSKEERKKVLRTGNITYDDNGFHPDYIPE
jgi:hypothetical protein